MDFIAGKKEGFLPFGESQHEEKFLLGMFVQITSRLKSRFNYTDEQIQKVFFSNEILVPVNIFSGNLSPAEALAKFLREACGLGHSKIAEVTGRDSRSIWSNYKRAIKKMPWTFEAKEGFLVPVSIFNSELSLLESLILYLRENGFGNSKIAKLLNKNPSNVWTLHKRACTKRNNTKNESQQGN